MTTTIINGQEFTDEDPLEKLLPKKGWLSDYVKFSSPLEACARFRFFTACCVLGSAIHNRVYLHRGDPDLLPKLFPNPWVLLLAPPGRGHKTSTINMGVNCVTQACPEVRIMADKLTPESLVKALSQPTEKEQIRIGPRDATGLIKAPELSVFFGKQQYNVGLVSLITDLYDYREEWASETIMRGKSVLKHICISIVGGSTPSWLQSMLPEDAFSGGFMSRFILVEMPLTYFKRRAEPKLSKHGPTWEELVQGLRHFSNVNGEMKWDHKGKKAYIKFYESLLPTGEAQQDAYQERETEQVIKIAMLIALSQGKMIVTEEHMNQSKTLIDALMEETAPRIERLTTHPRMKLTQEIEDYLKRYPKMSEKQLLQKLYRGLTHGEQQFREGIRMLLLTGKIEKGGKPTEPVYSLIKKEVIK